MSTVIFHPFLIQDASKKADKFLMMLAPKLHPSLPRFTFAIMALLALNSCTKSPMKTWETINMKVAHMRAAEANYEALRKEHEELKKAYFMLEHEHNALLAKVNSSAKAEKSLEATGSKLGLTPDMIHYEVPHGLSAEEMLSLAYEHLREKRFPAAAATFEKLFSSPEGAAFQDADALYAAGVAWYEVKNYNKALESFLAAKAFVHSGGEKESIRKKAELWQRVIERKLASIKEKGDH